MRSGAERWLAGASTFTSLAAVLLACSPSGSTSRGGAPASALLAVHAPTGASASSDDDGGGDDDGATRRARVEQGFAISPVALDTSGMGGRQRMLVGLGSYLVNAAGDCTGCHTAIPDRFLAGGVPFVLDAQGHTVWTRNLTPDPVTGMRLTLDQFKAAIRTGQDFHPGQTKMLVVMPWLYYRWQSDLDLEAIYAYLRAIPGVNNAVPPDDKDALPLPASIPFPGVYTDGDVVRRLRGDTLSFSFQRGLSVSPRPIPEDLRGETTRAYGVGSYVANATLGCNECHTHPDRTADSSRLNTAAFLTGGTVFLTPPPLQPVTGYVRATSSNLEGATFGFFSEPDDTFARFQGIMQTGTLIDENPPRPLAFPMFIIANSLKNLLEPDLRALYTYLSLTERTTGSNDVARQLPARFCTADSACRAGETCSGNECVGGPCSADADCGTCQTCNAGACQAPAPTSQCLLTAQ